MPRKTTADISRAARAVLEPALHPGETPLAEGRMLCVPRHFMAIIGSQAWGQTNNYVFVTDARLLWTDWLSPGPIAQLAFADVLGFSEHRWAHRYAIELHHRPTERLEYVPRQRFLWWSWGNAWARIGMERTVLQFSSEQTTAARAIRDRLAAFGVERS